jgi:tripartite-type tricarboxylate transporter receptor subunit TctC
MVAPKGTPDTVIATLNRIALEAMADPAVRDKLASQGATLVGDTPEHFRGFIGTEIKKWADVIKAAGVETAK